jgi:hypothetical protein
MLAIQAVVSSTACLPIYSQVSLFKKRLKNMFYMNYLLIKTKLNNNGVNMPKPIQFKTLLLLILLFSSSTNVFSQIIKPYIDHRWEDSRYIDHKDGTVTDTKTGLMWKQCSEGLSGRNCTGTARKYTYKTAIERADASANNPFATYSDWRLPNIKELRSLVAFDRYNPTINSRLFPNTPTYNFWSSSPYAKNTNLAWKLFFSNGDDNYGSRGYGHYVRLVRGGQ